MNNEHGFTLQTTKQIYILWKKKKSVIRQAAFCQHTDFSSKTNNYISSMSVNYFVIVFDITDDSIHIWGFFTW